MVAMALGLSQKFTNGLVNELNAKCSKAGKQWVRKDLMGSHREEHWGCGRGFLGLALWMAVNTFSPMFQQVATPGDQVSEGDVSSDLLCSHNPDN